MDNRTAIIILNALPGIGARRLRILNQAYPDLCEILHTPSDILCNIPGISSTLAQTIAHWRDAIDIDVELKLIHDIGAQIVTISDAGYPPSLREISDPPLCLYIRGDCELILDSRKCLAMVGSRHASAYGCRMASNLAAAAADSGMAVISGLARGIDTIVHRTVVESGGHTIAVLGSGLGHVYPYENIELADAICHNSGALISENPIMRKPNRQTFPIRNRIISGLSCGVIVVEAGFQSGSLITASQAIEQGRTVFAVPGPADVPNFRGNHALLRDGAVLTETYQDISDEFSLLPLARQQSHERNSPIPPKPPIELNQDIYDLWLKIPLDSPIAINELLANNDMIASELLAKLTMLEIKHAIRKLPGNLIIRTNETAILAANN